MPLNRFRRPLLATGALLCFAAAVVLTPTDVRSQLDLRRPDAIAQTEPHAPAPLVPVVPAGDAFAPRAETDDENVRTPIAAAILPRLPQLPQTGLRLANGATAVQTRITAIATGSHPTAIVESGDAVRAVTIGDSLDGSTIAAIGDDTVRLADGRHLSLAPSSPSP